MSEIIVKNQNDASKVVAKYIANQIKKKPNLVLGLATGSTPLKVYEELSKIIVSEKIDVSKVQGFALDEYVGLEKTHPESYYSIINKYVTIPLNLTPSLIHTPNGNAENIQNSAFEYEEQIKKSGGVDIQILGIGTDGHIGFNEPGSSLSSRTRIKTLTNQTRKDNARFFENQEQVPMHCITQGIGTILEAKHLILLAFGKNKASAISASLEGGITSFCPASAIQLHQHVSVFIDDDAASELKNLEYYQYAFENKPSWQEI